MPTCPAVRLRQNDLHGSGKAMATRIVLLQAPPVAMVPIGAAFAERWPKAETVNLLYDGLSLDRGREPTASPLPARASGPPSTG